MPHTVLTSTFPTNPKSPSFPTLLAITDPVNPTQSGCKYQQPEPEITRPPNRKPDQCRYITFPLPSSQHNTDATCRWINPLLPQLPVARNEVRYRRTLRPIRFPKPPTIEKADHPERFTIRISCDDCVFQQVQHIATVPVPPGVVGYGYFTAMVPALGG